MHPFARCVLRRQKSLRDDFWGLAMLKSFSKETTMLSEITEKVEYHMMSLICGI